MNSPSRVISFVNAGHFIDHYAMLIFAAAVIIMGPALGMAYSELLPYATPGFIAFGAGSLLTGWLGDRWSRRHMMLIFFIGIGLAMISVGFVQTPPQLGAALFAIGIFASIYHPVGTAMIVSYAEKLGREMGLNGVWGNLGVASSALVTGVIGQYFGWRFAFIVPGIVTILIGFAFAILLAAEVIIALLGWSAGGLKLDRRIAPTPDKVPNIEAIGHLLYSHYLFVFEGAGLVLLVAMIGAIVLTHRARGGVKGQKISRQVARRPQDATRNTQPPVGQGVEL